MNSQLVRVIATILVVAPLLSGLTILDVPDKNNFRVTSLFILCGCGTLAIISVCILLLKKDIKLRFNSWEATAFFYLIYLMGRAMFNEVSIDIYEIIVIVSFCVMYFAFKQLLASSKEYVYWLCIPIIITGFIELTIGVLQLFKVMPTRSAGGMIHGTFDNPNLFACYVSVVVPFYLLLSNQSTLLQWRKSIKAYVITFMLVTGTIVMVMITNCRSAWIGIIAAILIIINQRFQLVSQLKHSRIFLLISFILLLISSIALYKYKENSAFGRFLIWKNTALAGIEKPTFGYGINSFAGYHKSIQMDYFSDNENIYNRDWWVAADVQYAFNEYLQVFFEQGIIGIAFILLIIYQIIKRVNKSNVLQFSSILIILITCFFSYSLHCGKLAILTFYLLLVFSVSSDNIVLNVTRKHSVAIACMLLIFTAYCSFQVYGVVRAVNQWEKAEFFADSGYWSDAKPIYKKIFPYLYRNGGYLYNYGALLAENGEYEKSIEVLELSITRYFSSDVYFYLAESYKALGKYKEAEQAYRSAIASVPHKIVPRYRLALLYFENGECEKFRLMATQSLEMPIKIPSPITIQVKDELTVKLKDC
jgi:tetratricopeptide (TPR) repeat protein